MGVNSILIDTNAYVEFKRGNAIAIETIKKVKNIIFCPIVIGELLAGFKIGSQEERNRKELNAFMESKRVMSVSMNNLTSDEYAKLLKELRDKGNPIPTNDIWIAAVAKQFELTIFSFDKHFHKIDKLEVVP